MPTVFIPAMLKGFTGGLGQVEIEGATVREIVENLDRKFPGLAARLVEGGKLKTNLAVAIDGEVAALGLLEKVPASGEVHFVAAISGGSRGPALTGHVFHSGVRFAASGL
jgi:sulfur-carrier protein